jgi:hypothetical protein
MPWNGSGICDYGRAGRPSERRTYSTGNLALVVRYLSLIARASIEGKQNTSKALRISGLNSNVDQHF